MRTLLLCLLAAVWMLVGCPEEGDDDTAATDDDTADVGNQPPAQPEVSIYPDDPMPSDGLTASIDNYGEDPDGDVLTYTYTWWRDDVLMSDLTTAVVDVEHTARAEVWIVHVIASDGEFTTAPGGATTTIGNSPPTPPTNVAIEPAEPTTDDHLTCTGVVEEFDADGDPIEVSYNWYLDGAIHSNAQEILDSGDTETGQEWECEIVVSDGLEEMSMRSTVVTIL